MGTLLDPVRLFVSSHTHCADGTTRQDIFFYSTTLTNYAADVVSYATPLYNQVVNERASTGSAIGTFTTGEPYKGGTAAGVTCDLRLRLAIGQSATATPLRYSLVRQSELSDYSITSPTSVYDWVIALINRLKPVYLYPGGVNLV